METLDNQQTKGMEPSILGVRIWYAIINVRRQILTDKTLLTAVVLLGKWPPNVIDARHPRRNAAFRIGENLGVSRRCSNQPQLQDHRHSERLAYCRFLATLHLSPSLV
uniref:Uncharacterized protein n=1 Tax=Oryza brachyantha TaxID=4533 RepID=J3MF72_ORYBR